MDPTANGVIEDAERIAALRARVLARKRKSGGGLRGRNAVAMARSLQASEGCDSWQVRRGLLTRDRLAAARFDLDELDLLIGRPCPPGNGFSDEEWKAAEAYLAQYPGAPGQTGHCELHTAPAMQAGIDGVAHGIRARLNGAAGDTADACQSFLYALEGLSTLIENAAAAAEQAATAASGARRAELDEMAASCRRIAHDAPESFRDALQLIWFATLGVMFGEDVGLVVPGHLDRTLRPFYEADMAAGRLTRDRALLLIENAYLLINDFIPDGLAMSVMVGGRDADGNDVTNDLSYLCIEAIRRTGLIYPTVGVCWHAGTPPDLVKLAVDLIGHGYATPAFFGDDTIQRGLRTLGVPPDEACYYINSTCVEITPATGSNVWVASPYFSMCRILLDEIDDEVASGYVPEGFEAFRERYLARLGKHIQRAAAAQNEARRLRREHGRKPLQSCFTRDCIARGKDIDDGGALYNWVECSFVGLANATDSLHVIRREVFEEKRLPLARLKAVLDADFEGHEPIRRRFSEHYAKYGQDDAELDRHFGELVEFVRRECAKHEMAPDGSPFVPGAFCWVMHERLGRECPATPDGRRAGTPFADGCGPAQGREKRGPTAAILSTTSWDHSPMIGGLAYNMKFNRSFFDSPKGFALLEDLVLTFLRRGGFETQVNVVDAEVLKSAREHPDDYRDLVVRIGGYCDYFTRLSPEMQDEIIMRTEFTAV
ncbi:MAG: hypothetical protein JXR94_21680 [Candidatus Hydrogenedentes bacterium]|nr:hypothetical protein [Candidatus Hydrogenedentota bacterium]